VATGCYGLVPWVDGGARIPEGRWIFLPNTEGKQLVLAGNVGGPPLEAGGALHCGPGTAPSLSNRSTDLVNRAVGWRQKNAPGRAPWRRDGRRARNAAPRKWESPSRKRGRKDPLRPQTLRRSKPLQRPRATFSLTVRPLAGRGRRPKTPPGRLQAGCARRSESRTPPFQPVPPGGGGLLEFVTSV